VHQATQVINKVFLTGMDQKGVLLKGPADEIKKQIEDALRDALPGHLMVGPGCAIDAATPGENLAAASETAKGFVYD
jgi:uroporphyrinogen-III decarboxylase